MYRLMCVSSYSFISNAKLSMAHTYTIAILTTTTTQKVMKWKIRSRIRIGVSSRIFTLHLILLRVCFVEKWIYVCIVHSRDKTWHRFTLIFDTIFMCVIHTLHTHAPLSQLSSMHSLKNDKRISTMRQSSSHYSFDVSVQFSMGECGFLFLL